MNQFNPNALVFLGWCTCVGALSGSWLWGLTIGLTIIVLLAVKPTYTQLRTLRHRHTPSHPDS
jgi:hypothetical protein